MLTGSDMDMPKVDKRQSLRWGNKSASQTLVPD